MNQIVDLPFRQRIIPLVVENPKVWQSNPYHFMSGYARAVCVFFYLHSFIQSSLFANLFHINLFFVLFYFLSEEIILQIFTPEYGR